MDRHEQGAVARTHVDHHLGLIGGVAAVETIAQQRHQVGEEPLVLEAAAGDIELTVDMPLGPADRHHHRPRVAEQQRIQLRQHRPVRQRRGKVEAALQGVGGGSVGFEHAVAATTPSDGPPQPVDQRHGVGAEPDKRKARPISGISGRAVLAERDQHRPDDEAVQHLRQQLVRAVPARRDCGKPAVEPCQRGRIIKRAVRRDG